MRQLSDETMRELNADELELVGGGLFGLPKPPRPPFFPRRGGGGNKIADFLQRALDGLRRKRGRA